MAITKFLFSSKQKAMREALGGAVMSVKTPDGWKEYTMSVDTLDGNEDYISVWNDMVLVAEGEGLETRTGDETNNDQ